MNLRKVITGGLILAAVIAVPLLGAQDAQAPQTSQAPQAPQTAQDAQAPQTSQPPQARVVNIDPNRHGNLAAAQGDIVDAYQ